MPADDRARGLPRRDASDLDTATRTAAEAPPSATKTALVPGLTVLWHPDPRRVGERTPLLGLREGSPLSRLEPGFAPPERERRRPLGDPYLSRKPLVLRRRGTGMELLRGDSPTAVRVDGEPLDDRRELAAGGAGALIELGGRVLLLLHEMDPTPPPRPAFFDLVGESVALARLAQEVAAVADLDVPVLLRGETGTGKERVARCLHAASGRRGAFVAVNVGALPPSLAAAELFGSQRGAFTGADRVRSGHCLRADGGTLLLDEIGEAPAEVQVALLRALETGRILPVGADAERAVDLRWLAATDAPLEALVASGGFRAPLVHRLSGVVLELPPLRERRDDVARLFLHFLRQELTRVGEASRLEGEEAGTTVATGLVAELVAAPWPGNVRQLQNVVRRMVVASRGGGALRLSAALRRELAGPGPLGPPARDGGNRRRDLRPPQEVTDDEIRRALAAHDWRVKAAATALGISRGALYRRIEASPELRTGASLGAREIRDTLARHDGSVAAAARALEVSPEALRRRLGDLGD